MVKKKILLAVVILVMAIFALFQVAAKDALEAWAEEYTEAYSAAYGEQDEESSSGAGIGLLFLLGLYFAPSLVALLRKKKNLVAIFALNLLLGWTVIGWIVALIWSLTAGGQEEPEKRSRTKTKKMR